MRGRLQNIADGGVVIYAPACPDARHPYVIAQCALSLLQTVPEPVEQGLTTENQIHESSTACKSVVAAHYTKATEDMPDAKMTAKQLLYDLIHHMYSEDELRELAGGAGTQHGRTTKKQALRERLAQHFAELLSERDDA